MDHHMIIAETSSCRASSVDLTPLFNWNTKQLFLYLGAEYTNEQGVRFFLDGFPFLYFPG